MQYRIGFGTVQLVAKCNRYGRCRDGLIDPFRIAINPVILGEGALLLNSGYRVKLRLVDAQAMSTGVVVHRYALAG